MTKIKYLIRTIVKMDFKEMFKTINKIHSMTHKCRLFLFIDVIYCGLKYQAGYMDYFVFELHRVPNKLRNTYITRGVNNSYVRRLNDRSLDYILDDKAETLKLFSDVVKRDWLDLRNNNIDDFKKFVKNNKKFVSKVYNGTGGKGISIHENIDENVVEDLYNQLKNEHKYVVEGYIKQHSKINDLCSSAINTIRIVTIKSKIVFCSMRLANEGKVDNLHSGGMGVIIDENTGKISKPGVDKELNVFHEHPISKIKFLGYEIPYFQQAKQMAIDLSYRLPKVGYIGWDFAVTEEGIDFVEANLFPGNDFYQFQAHLDNMVGLKPKFDKVIEEK